MPLLFDCHLDLAWNALTWRRDLALPLAELNNEDNGADQKFRGRATTTLPEMRSGKVAVCLATVMGRVPYGDDSLHGSSLDFPTHEQVYAFARSHLAWYEAMERRGDFRILRSRDALDLHWKEWSVAKEHDRLPIGVIVSMEGADAIVTPDEADHWFDLGLRCASLVHYGSSQYAVGTGEEGPLTAAGKQLLEEFDSSGMILDVTHLSDESFDEAMRHHLGPVVATHQACRQLVPHQRQFSDDQLKRVINRQGLICVPCDAWMLHPGWIRGETNRSVLSIDVLADHIDHICQLAGSCLRVGIGSDLDGGYGTEQTPTGLDSIADLQKLEGILAGRGYGASDIAAIMGENALRFFMQHLPESS